MSFSILGLLLISSLLHATWNFLAKSIPGGILFVWLLAFVMTLLLLPIVGIWVYYYGDTLTWNHVGALLMTSIVHLAYFVVLQEGYQKGDLSVVYPLARGTGPMFTTLAAVIFLGEHLSIFACVGLCLVLVGVFAVSGIGQKKQDASKVKIGVFYGIFTGILIAIYTVWDGYTVKQLGIAPILVEFVSHPFRVLVLLPVAWNQKNAIKSLWDSHKVKILAVAILSPIAFLLVLHAMKSAPIHLVAPTREISIVFGVIIGAKFLTEENFVPRLIGSLLILAGIVLLQMG